MSDTPCPECKAIGLWCVITTEKRVPAETDDGSVYFVHPEDVIAPDVVQVELHCPSCDYSPLLSDTEWEAS